MIAAAMDRRDWADVKNQLHSESADFPTEMEDKVLELEGSDFDAAKKVFRPFECHCRNGITDFPRW
jgi:hypothetical protein